MFGTMRSDNFAGISDFNDAERYYNSTPQIRGRSNKVVPLRPDRKQTDTYTIEQWDNGDTYAMVLYSTGCVLFHRNGDITIDASYDSSTTRQFIDAFTWRIGLSISLQQYTQIWNIGATTLCDRQRKKFFAQHTTDDTTARLLMKTNTVRIKRTKTGWQIPETSIKKGYSEVVDRVKAKKARKPFNNLFETAKFYSHMPLTWEARQNILESSTILKRPYNSIRYYGSNEVNAKGLIDLWFKTEGGIPEEQWIDFIAYAHEQKYNYDTHSRSTTFNLDTFRKSVQEALYQKLGCFKRIAQPWGVLPNKRGL